MSSTPQKSKDFPASFFRVSIKGLYVKDGKILLLQESEKTNFRWELPGGGLDFGETPQEGLKREVFEETGLLVKSISQNPIYAWQNKFENKRGMDWYCSFLVLYKMELENLNFTPSEECINLGFFSIDEIKKLDLNIQTKELLNYFKPEDFK